MLKEPQKAKGGRPPYVPELEDRNRVAVAAGGGMTHEEIALGLGIDRKTLEKHFEHELSIGAYKKRLEVLEAMYKTAMSGNVTAQRAYVALSPAAAAPPAPLLPAEAELGKKERAKIDARVSQRGTEWENLLPGPVRPQ